MSNPPVPADVRASWAAIGRAYAPQDPVMLAHMTVVQSWLQGLPTSPECRCVEDCVADPATACSLSGEPHVHPDSGNDTFGPYPQHPDAPGDL